MLDSFTHLPSSVLKSSLSRTTASGSGKAIPSPLCILNHNNCSQIVPGAFFCILKELCHISQNNASCISLMLGGSSFLHSPLPAYFLQCEYINSQKLQGKRNLSAACTLGQSLELQLWPIFTYTSVEFSMT